MRINDLMRYLGGINLAPAVLAFIRLYAVYSVWACPVCDHKALDTITGTDVRMDVLALTALFAANASQCVLNFGVLRGSGRWIVGNGYDRIS